jgi:hypothetical protein
MKNILIFLLIPYMTYSQTLSEKESCEIYNSCLVDYTKDSTSKFLVCESTVYYKYDWKNIELNKMIFSPFNEKPPVDSNFIDLFQKFKLSDTSTINLNFLTKCSNKDRLAIFMNKQYQSIFNGIGSGYDKFHRYFKDYYCFYNFSNITISKNHKYAILYMSHKCDEKGGAGYLLLCFKVKDVWIVKHSIMLWIS